MYRLTCMPMSSRWVLSSAALGLCAVLLSPGLFLKGWVDYEQREYRKSVRRVLSQGVDAAKLSRIATPLHGATQVEWVHHKEFRHRGSMYDIVYREYRPDSAIYWCWWDADENRLMSDLDRLVGGLRKHDPRPVQTDVLWTHFIKGFWMAAEGPDRALFHRSSAWPSAIIHGLLDGFSPMFGPPPEGRVRLNTI